MNKVALPAILVVIVAIMVGVFLLGNGPSNDTKTKPTYSTRTSADGLPGLLTTPAPWAANLDKLKDRLDAIGLPALSQEALAFHIHQHLDMFVHGKPVTLPANVGINASANFISVLHVHDTTGVIHVESPTQTEYTLGQFFDEWGVRLSQTCMGGYCTDSTNKLQAFVNGKPLVTDPRQYKLKAHDEIVLAYGTDAELPNPVPASFMFPQGE